VVFRKRHAAPVASLFDPSKVDLITRDAAGLFKPIVVQDQPWTGSQAETQSLLDKITNYTSHAQNGGLSVADAAWQIVIDSYTGPPPGACLSALREMAESLRRIGSDLRLHELAPPQHAGEPPTTVRESSL
jgi:hypothetical protein